MKLIPQPRVAESLLLLDLRQRYTFDKLAFLGPTCVTERMPHGRASLLTNYTKCGVVITCKMLLISLTR